MRMSIIYFFLFNAVNRFLYLHILIPLRESDFMLKKKIGIVGGGQLGRMLINESIRYDLEIAVLDPDVNAPCKSLAHTFHCGSLQDFDTVYAFGKTCDIITIEIENIHVDALEKLASEGIHVFPQPHIIRMIQDKVYKRVLPEK